MQIDVSVVIRNSGILEKLKEFPIYIPWAVNHALRDTLARTRTQMVRYAKERYTAPYGWLLGQEKIPYFSNMQGHLHTVGAKIPLGLLPHNKQKGGKNHPGGVQVEEVIGQVTDIRHAFTNAGGVKFRTGKGAPRFPVWNVPGLSAAEMMGHEPEVFPQTEKFVEEKLAERLDYWIGAALAKVG